MCRKCRSAWRRKEADRPETGRHCEQNVPALSGRSQVQAGDRHCSGDAETGRLWEDHPGVGRWMNVQCLICVKTLVVLCVHVTFLGSFEVLWSKKAKLQTPTFIYLLWLNSTLDCWFGVFSSNLDSCRSPSNVKKMQDEVFSHLHEPYPIHLHQKHFFPFFICFFLVHDSKIRSISTLEISRRP